MYRRKIVKEPIDAFGGGDSLMDFLDKLEAMSSEMKAQEELYLESFDDQQKPSTPSLNECKNYLFDIMIKDAESELSDTITAYKTLCITSDLRIPHEWYPYARLIKRKIIYHGGPTNSGKTYQALQRLRFANAEKGGGLYCGPLRLLALEIYESLNKQGVYTDLVTGQERREVDFATHVSCTLEMVKLKKEYDVAVIDEIQMINDPQRGYAWTKALLGLRAREIHVCGGLEAAEIVKSLVAMTGDDFELIEYKRLSTLVVNDESLQGDYAKILPGDCVVAFSKADIFSIRRQIERLTPYKCAMIYGQLPPETRSTQARLFNEENTGYDVLVASDAIGMGLNLNIKRIVFHTTIKTGGKDSAYWCGASSVKQIAGRAGRMSSNYKIGEVTAWQDADLAYIRSVMTWDIPMISSAGIFPSVEQIDNFSLQLAKSREADIESEDEFNKSLKDSDNDMILDENNEVTVIIDDGSKEIDDIDKRKKIVDKSHNTRLAVLLERFVESAKVDGRYFLCDHESIIVVSNWLHTVPLTLSERFVSSLTLSINLMFSLYIYEFISFLFVFLFYFFLPLFF
jgi:hypothetical protein